ncbi:unnamed protein product [Arabidopsis thaliana]|uniref:(thale cress) hypothetical protein n=1 Tax=Arabidopsis thaliana TaxID=3702 RepID=A0A7G2EV99_ARATH|nr:unnamed protein product [Arabidopsis thaliana]
MPAGILAKIVGYIAEGGIGELKNWILSGREGMVDVFSPDNLKSVRLDKTRDFVYLSSLVSVYNLFFLEMCKGKKSLCIVCSKPSFGFPIFYIEEAIEIAAYAKEVYLVAELLYIMLKSLAGKEDREVYSNFLKKYNYEEAQGFCETLKFHIKTLPPKRFGTYSETWCFTDSPMCWESHQFLDEYNGGPYIVERCIDCIYFYLSRDIMEMS